MKIQPFIGEAIYLHEDGKTFEEVPIQVFRGSSGDTLIRIGRNVFFIGPDGRYDGSECKPGGMTRAEAEPLIQAFERQNTDRKKSCRPATAYYEEGSPGWKAETADWPPETDLTSVRVHPGVKPTHN